MSDKDTNQEIETPPPFKYYHSMLNMADDDLDPYQYRLLGHYIRVGICWESTRTTAKTTQMSNAKVSTARRELEAMGYITCKENKKTGTIRVQVVDRMPENVARYHEGGVNLVNSGVNGVNRRNKPIEEINQEESTVSSDEDALPPLSPDEEEKEKEINKAAKAIIATWKNMVRDNDPRAWALYHIQAKVLVDAGFNNLTVGKYIKHLYEEPPVKGQAHNFWFGKAIPFATICKGIGQWWETIGSKPDVAEPELTEAAQAELERRKAR